MAAEHALDPELPICDAHHHLWDHGPKDRWMLEDAVEDFTGSGHNIVSTVLVDTDHAYRTDGPPELRTVGETEWADTLGAAKHGSTHVAAAFVGRVDLTLGSRVGGVLEAHLAASSRFRGLRHWLNNDPHAEAAGFKPGAPPRLAYDPKFREGFAQLERHGLLFDAWIFFSQLGELVDLARAFPRTSIVLGHAGGLLGCGPYADRAAYFPVWRNGMKALAECGNVTVKLGGFGSPRAGFGWHLRPAPPSSRELADTLGPYCLAAIELFGVGRCMFESNFPPDRPIGSYTTVWNAYKRITRGFSAAERAALFHDTAARVYRLAD